jgi:hypothetical protein
MNEIAQIRQDPALQTSLFETDDGHYTNTIDIWDIAPRYVFYTDRKKGEAFLKSIRRSFDHAGVSYSLVMRPGRLVRADGTETEQFPGERESIVEAVLLHFASERGRLSVYKNKLRLSFTLYEIREELKKRRHTFSIAEIRDALTVLHTSIVEITQTGESTTNVLSSAAIPVLALRKKGEDERHVLEFNPLVENSIKCGRFRRMHYEWLMELEHPLSRWLYKKLCQPNMGMPTQGATSVSMSAMDIASNGGVSLRSRPRDTLRFVARAVDSLVEVGLLEPVERETEREGRRYTDILFDLVPTPKFMAEMRRADILADDGRARLKVVAGTDAPDRFVPVERHVTTRARAERKRLSKEELPA